MELEAFKVLFYKDSSIIVLINLMNGNYFIPSIESYNDKKEILKILRSNYHISVDDVDIILDNGNNYIFVGEWDGLFSVDADSLRSKWILIDDLNDESLNLIRNKYRDIVDSNGNVIAIATLEETTKHNLRYRSLKYKKNYYSFLLGESFRGICKRLLKESKNKDKNFAFLLKKILDKKNNIKNSFEIYTDKDKHLCVYELKIS